MDITNVRAQRFVDRFYRTPARPASNSGQLRAIADWLDSLDDIVDAVYVAGDRLPRTIQQDLRRIAEVLE